MHVLTGILFLLTSLPLLSLPVQSQTGNPTRTEMLAMLRSGNPQRVSDALDAIRQTPQAQELYANLYQLAGSEPPSQKEASAVAKALGFVLFVGIDVQGETLTMEEYDRKILRLEKLFDSIDPD
ncbi:MAG: hypothetical protein KFH87_02820, partial [Bacteroidetes bacterium]|nr:hypothetical protein [Bacteroidota bacterium]